MLKSTGDPAFANVTVIKASSSGLISTKWNPATSSPTRISKGGIAAAVILSTFGFCVIVGLMWYYLGGNKDAAKGGEQAAVQQDSYEGASREAQPGTQTDHGRVKEVEFGITGGTEMAE